MITTKLELLVDFGDKPEQALVNKTVQALKDKEGVKEAVYKDGAIMVESSLPTAVVVDIASKVSGRRTVLQGFGDPSRSAVAMISSQGAAPNIMGVIRFTETAHGMLADGTVAGLSGTHGLHVRETGDLSQGCSSLGPHYNPHGAPHGPPAAPAAARHAGDLGNITADETGTARFTVVDSLLKISDIIGRSIAVTERPDDFGTGDSASSKIDGNSGPAIACGIIARSAGIFQNPKRVCACDGVVVWDERDRPLAGQGRRDKAKPCCQKEKACCGDSKGGSKI
ncbi:copper chaperone for superoxide dismutase [Plutella xylostella]|uniref:copper chaperone for superoxide dismutase n=1 Tax=Plutella xylostella TaxID=51655 RepID=UPI002032D3AE|nr:copper chaperone for superoxide dismutase [Plutella xylostella]XP_048480190.1 copper chaperone for superoxide dismutase [Plutella xylostella]